MKDRNHLRHLKAIKVKFKIPDNLITLEIQVQKRDVRVISIPKMLLSYRNRDRNNI